MSKLAARLAFLPSLVWDVVVCQLIRRLNWWDQVDENLVLGAYPFGGSSKQLWQLGVRSVINTCEEFAGPVESYKQLNIEQIRIPIVDFTEPTLEDINRSIEFIERNRQLGKVYVHCKSGRGRSATLALCWIMKTYQLSPEQAQQKLSAQRKQVLTHLYKRDCVKRYWEQLKLAS